MEVELLSLLCVESPYPRWFRFTFTAECVGGKLRTLAEQDSETMEAGWIPVEQIYTGKLNLR